MTFGLRLLFFTCALISVLFMVLSPLHEPGLARTMAVMVWLGTGLTACFVAPFALTRR